MQKNYELNPHVGYSHSHILRREVLLLWKQRNGAKATYNKLISAFESTGYQNYADNVKRMLHVNIEEADVSGGSAEFFSPVPQPPTYSVCHLPRNSPPSSPEDCCYEREEYELLDSSSHDETKGIVVSLNLARKSSMKCHALQ